MVGPGTDSEFDGSGFLSNWQTYVQNGIVSPYASMSYAGEFSVNDTNIGSVISIYLNGIRIAQEAVASGVTTDCIKIPIQDIKFAHRVPGGTPNPGQNTVAVSIDGNYTNEGAGINLGNLSFQAMAPIIMVHGCCGEDGSWFSNANLFPNYTNTTYRPFTTPFDAAKFPYDNSINLNPESTIQVDGAKLLALLPQKAAEFGAKHVHIVAHSKGGLNSRYVLRQLNQQRPASLGVYSLTTLSTPHHGSALSDYYVDSEDALLTGNDNNGRVAVAKAKRMSGTDKSIADLRVSDVEVFDEEEAQNPLPTEFTVDGIRDPVKYYAVSADAGESPSNHQLTLGDIFGMPAIPGPTGTNLFVYQQLYELLGEVFSTQLRWLAGARGPTVGEHYYCLFQPCDFVANDLAVTRNSANYISPSVPPVSFQEISFLQNQNHASESNALNLMALTVIQSIKAAQPIH